MNLIFVQLIFLFGVVLSACDKYQVELLGKLNQGTYTLIKYDK